MTDLNLRTTRLPYAYTELEYLQSSGTQYIDTGYKPNQDTIIKCVTQFNKPFITAFTRWSPQPAYDTFGLYSTTNQSSPLVTYYGKYQNGYYKFHYDYVNNTKIYWECSPTKIIIRSDDGSYNIDEDITRVSFQSTQNLWLFSANNNGQQFVQSATGRIYSVQILDNDTLVRNFIPSKRKSDNVLGMYDLVSCQFFTNQGTGSFTAGNPIITVPTIEIANKDVAKIELPHLVDTYETLEYLQSSGTQWIDTGLSLVNGYRTTARVVVTDASATGTIIGSSAYTNNAWSNRNYVVASKGKDWLVGYGGSGYQYFGNYATNTTYDIDFCNIHNRESLKVNNTTYSISKTGTSGTFYDGNLYMFANNGSGTAQLFCKLKIYNLKVYDENDTLVRDYIPVIRKSDNVAGMFDKVNQVFYTNKGTGSFTAGSKVCDGIMSEVWKKADEVPSIYERKNYLEGTGTQYIDTGFIADEEEI